MRLFLIVFDRIRGQLVEIREYGPTDRERALADRFERELDERHQPQIEVVLLAAESLDALRQTHSRYFFGSDLPLAEAF